MPDTAELLAAYDALYRPAEVETFPPGTRFEVDDPVLRVFSGHRGYLCTPPDLRRDGAEADEFIARQRDAFAARGEAVEWKLRGHDRPADLPERLQRAGFRPEAQETVMVGLVEELAALPVELPEGVGVRQVRDPADMERIAAMETAVWGEDWGWLARELTAHCAVEPSRVSVFVAETLGGDEPEVVSAAWLVEMPATGFAGLCGGSTLPAWRRRGLYRSLVAVRARLAATRGVRWLQVDASDESRPLLEGFGMVALTTTTPYVWSPQG
ncbi:hypothetical protein CLV92_11596 [Kineococcus xinjiangensis]|uniref:N-acetyltransferase domain-containing protein n=1 Tax=Kineococcus xinjiangensis TaxID=512762 RepID=A0A2S6IDV9_9ACTN|nr:GNAT family N-acetyltransferase [Kineococcus xinjiangensis]PPK92350.1 hypothetical protein CLV92_11596 [Kineococcus xinjiangensis]